MRFKKITSLALTVACLMSTAVFPVHAAGETSDTAECIDESLYHQFTIDFTATPYTIQSSEENTAFSKNKANVNSAINFVQSLDLADQGYEYIEESCLTQLHDFAELENFSLDSYTVLVPKMSSTTPAYYGTYDGFTFYSADYSKYTATVHGKRTKIFNDNTDVKRFISEVADIAFLFVDNTAASLAYSTVAVLLDASSKNFEVTTQDTVTGSIKLDLAYCRGIYTKSGPNGSFVRYYSSERATIHPVMIYYPVAHGLPTSVTVTLNTKSVTMPNYYNETYQMQQAYNWIMNSGVEYPERHYMGSEVGTFAFN